MGSGLTLRRHGLWLLVCNSPLLVRGVGILLVVIAGIFMVGCPLAVAAVLSCMVQADRWIAPHLAVRTFLDCCKWTGRVTQPVQRTHLWPASWLPADQSRGSKSVEVRRVWKVYDERLQFLSRQNALHLDESLDAGDVSRAWLVWSGAAEAALADAYQFSGGPLPSGGLVLGRGIASFRLVRLGGHQIRKARGNAADALDAADVFLYRDSSVAPLLDMRRRFKAAMDVLGCHDSLWSLSFKVGGTHCSVGQDSCSWAFVSCCSS